MSVTIKTWTAGAAAAVLLLGAGHAARAEPVGSGSTAAPVNLGTLLRDPQYTYQFYDPADGAVGTLTTQVWTGGELVESGTLNVAIGPDAGTYSLVTKLNTPPNVSTSPLGAFLYDDVLYPSAPPGQQLDVYGLLFNNGLPTSSPDYDEINIWGNSGPQGTYTFYDARPSGWYPNAQANVGTFVLTPMPEPAFLQAGTLLALAGGGALRSRRLRLAQRVRAMLGRAAS
jgi:hypothetical protein